MSVIDGWHLLMPFQNFSDPLDANFDFLNFIFEVVGVKFNFASTITTAAGNCNAFLNIFDCF